MDQRIVIIGGGLAGVTAAETLRSSGFDGSIRLIADETHLPYTKPPLSKQLLRGEMTVEAMAFRGEAWYADKGIELLRGSRATSINTNHKYVQLADGEDVPYDSVLMATGGRPRDLNVAGADLDGVHTLRTLEDAAAIREQLTPGAPILVIGAGFIGAEVAASASLLGCDVTILEVAAAPLTRVLGPEVGAIYTEVHRDHGVDVRCGVGLEEIVGTSRVSHVIDTRGNVHEASAVIVGVGLIPNDEIAISAGLRVGNGVIVDTHCRTSASGVFAAGDITFHPNPILGRSIRVEQWQNAQHQGRDAARNMLGIDRQFSEVPWFWSDQYDLNLQMAGMPAGVDERVFRGNVADRTFSVFYLKDGVLEGVVGINSVGEVRAGRRLIAQRAVISPDVLADQSIDLAALAYSNASV